MQKIVILSGAGISAESGLKTFRDQDGLWNNYRIEEVASPEAWSKNPQLVLDFYNQRRKQLFEVKPNAAHYSLAKLEKKYEVVVITQNVDDLHERAGSKNVLHLHGELKKVKSTIDENLVYELDGWELKLGDKCAKGSQLRPHIVWFGEAVPNIIKAKKLAEMADVFMVIGTSLMVYPAATLINYVPDDSLKYMIDPNASDNMHLKNMTVCRNKAVEGVTHIVDQLLQH